MLNEEEDRTPTNITVWACSKCGYWRDEKHTGVHAATNPDDPTGHLLTHELRQVLYARAEWGED